MITSESARYLMARTNAAFEHPELVASLGGAAKCWSCRVGLNVALGAAITVAIVHPELFSSELPAIIAATGLSEEKVNEILSDIRAGGFANSAKAVERAIEELCKAMGSCN